MLNLALVGDKGDGDLYPEDDASSEKDIISLHRKGGDSDDEDLDEDEEDDDDDEDELNTDEESSVGGVDPSVPSTSTRGLKERSSGAPQTPAATIRGCLKSRPCTICVYLCLALLILASVVSLIVVGVLVAAPYRKAMTFQDTLCVALRTQEQGEDRRCSCGKGCNSKYSCIEVKVALPRPPPPPHPKVLESSLGARDEDNYTGVSTSGTSSGKDTAPREVILYENEATLDRECSYYPPCKSSRAANEKAVRDYEHKFGTPGKKYPCLYNPSNPSEVIRTRRFHLQHVVHGMLWSSLVFLVSLAILIFAIKKKGCDFL